MSHRLAAATFSASILAQLFVKMHNCRLKLTEDKFVIGPGIQTALDRLNESDIFLLAGLADEIEVLLLPLQSPLLRPHRPRGLSNDMSWLWFA